MRKTVETAHKRYYAERVYDRYKDNRPEVGAAEQSKYVHSLQSACMMDFINKWGMVAAIPDGEDSAGRSKLRLATSIELVERAEEVTKLAFKALRDNGWLEETVDLGGLRAELQDEIMKSEDD